MTCQRTESMTWSPTCGTTKTQLWMTCKSKRKRNKPARTIWFISDRSTSLTRLSRNLLHAWERNLSLSKSTQPQIWNLTWSAKQPISFTRPLTKQINWKRQNCQIRRRQIPNMLPLKCFTKRFSTVEWLKRRPSLANLLSFHANRRLRQAERWIILSVAFQRLVRFLNRLKSSTINLKSARSDTTAFSAYPFKKTYDIVCFVFNKNKVLSCFLQ